MEPDDGIAVPNVSERLGDYKVRRVSFGLKDVLVVSEETASFGHAGMGDGNLHTSNSSVLLHRPNLIYATAFGTEISDSVFVCPLSFGISPPCR